MIEAYLEVGTLVWEVDYDLRTVRVDQPGGEPRMFRATQELVGNSYLPGFQVPVAKLFEP